MAGLKLSQALFPDPPTQARGEVCILSGVKSPSSLAYLLVFVWRSTCGTSTLKTNKQTNKTQPQIVLLFHGDT